jgi:hypothetical protein
VTIVPEEKYPFEVLETKAKAGKNINYKLTESIDKKGHEQYVLTVENVKKEKGRYYDAIHIKTNSKIKPEIKILVYGIIDAKPQKKP